MFNSIRSESSYKFLFNGKWIESKGRKTLPVRNPSNGSILGSIQSMTIEEANEAILSASASQKSWAALPMHQRAAILHKAADILAASQELLAELLVKEVAKPKGQALDEVLRTVILIHETAEEGLRIRGSVEYGDAVPGGRNDKFALVERQPYGVVLAISPFNFPINLAASKIAPALVAGNSVVFKPSSQGAICGLHLAEAFNQAGVPAGVLNVVTGSGSDIGDYLTSHPGVGLINFTGSTAVGLKLKARAIPLFLEMGGKDAAIVLDDADIELAAKEISAGAFQYSGQRCTGIKRVLPMPSIADELIHKIVAEVEKLKVGLPEDDCGITPIIGDPEPVQQMIDEALRSGAKLLIGNKRQKNLIWPTVLDNVTPDMKIAWVEPFAPVLPIIRVKDENEAIELSNRSEYGLEASVFTRNINKAFAIARRLDVGVVQINGKSARGPDNFAFTGFKASGIGSQGIRYAIESMTRLKTTVINLKA